MGEPKGHLAHQRITRGHVVLTVWHLGNNDAWKCLCRGQENSWQHKGRFGTKSKKGRGSRCHLLYSAAAWLAWSALLLKLMRGAGLDYQLPRGPDASRVSKAPYSLSRLVSGHFINCLGPVLERPWVKIYIHNVVWNCEITTRRRPLGSNCKLTKRVCFNWLCIQFKFIF